MKTIIILTLTLMCSVVKAQLIKMPGSPLTKPVVDSVWLHSIDERFAKLGYIKAIDSVKINLDQPPIENARSIQANLNYELADSVWISNDSNWIVFRYFTKPETKDSGIQFFDILPIDSIKWEVFETESYQALMITDDTGAVFYYTTEDTSQMYVGDSLRVIKWLIEMLLKKDSPPEIHKNNEPINKDTNPDCTEPIAVLRWKPHEFYCIYSEDLPVKKNIVWQAKEIK